MTLAEIPIIVTRAEPGASETVERLKARGLTAIPAPMLSLVELPDIQMPEPLEISGIVFTSATGDRTYETRRADRH